MSAMLALLYPVSNDPGCDGAATYGTRSRATNKNKLYDSYLRAIRWASDRVLATPHGGVVAFVTNGGYIDSNSLDGLRRTVVDEFHHVYVFNLRGNQRTAADVSRREGGKIFDAGSRATVAIILLVKKPGSAPTAGATLQYREIGDYLSRQEKLGAIAAALPIRGNGPPVLGDLGWRSITPNEHGDWINQRSASFATHLDISSGVTPGVFKLRTLGLATGRDAWNYNSSRGALDANVTRMIEAYNAAADAYDATRPTRVGSLAERAKRVEATIPRDPRLFSWNRNAFTDVARGTRYSIGDRSVMQALYRPFHYRWAETSRRLNAMVYQLPRVFPTPDSGNLVIAVSNQGARSGFSVLMSARVPDLNVWIDPTPCFPRYLFSAAPPSEANLPGLSPPPSNRQHNVTDYALAAYRQLDSSIDDDDVFFYVYGILHSPDYRQVFASDLKKSLPRIPQVTDATDFWAFSEAGRELARLHTDYENIDVWPELTYTYASGFDPDHPDAYRVLKMKHPKVADQHNPKAPKLEDRTRIVYNDWITIGSIPERAYAFELGSRSAIGWVMESNRVRTDKASGIRNDPNDWGIEHGNSWPDPLKSVHP